MTYKPEQRAIAVAAVQRYGLTAARDWLEMEWPDGPPSVGSLHKWKAEVEVTEEALAVLDQRDAERKSKWQAGIDGAREDLIGAVRKATRDGKALAAQQFAVATGIFYDKMFPQPKAGGGQPLVGSAQTVQMLVVAPAPGGDGTHLAGPPAGKRMHGEDEVIDV